MQKHNRHNKEKIINFLSVNGISAIISKFEAKSHSIRTKNDTNNKMSGTDTLQSDEVFYDSFLTNSNGNKRSIQSEVLPNAADTNIKTFNNRSIPSRGKSLINLFSWFVFLLSSVNGAIATTLTFVLLLPRALIKSLFYPGYRLLFGTLYPAYASYKAVRTKNVKEYVKWMMYWIVFALFSCTETFTDIFISWFPFYYEIKIIIVLWLLSPATKGSSTLYRKFVHPMLTKREQEIDEYISQAKEKGYSAVLQYGSKGVNYATSVIMQTALKGGGNLVSSLKKSYSLSDLSEPDVHRSQDEVDSLTRSQRVLRPRTHSTRSSSSGRNVDMHFSEVDIIDSRPRGAKDDYRSSEDISSGYSSAEPLPGGLSRTASMTNASKIRLRPKKSEDLDSLEFESLISDPLSMHSKILLSRYPMLNDQLQLRHYDDSRGEGFEYGGQNKNSSLETIDQQEDKKNVTIDEIDSAKFALFCKWLNESNFETRSQDVKGVSSFESIDKDSSDDEFLDTNNETGASILDKQFKDTLPSVIEQANISSTVHETSQTEEEHPITITEKVVQEMSQLEKSESEPIRPNEDHIYETLLKMPSRTNLLELPNPSLLSLNLSCTSSASDLTSENGNSRRPVSHNKGRAPPVPSASTQSISDKTSETTPQDKEKKKKNLLTYIPSIFKPITPSNSSKNLTKETEI